MRADGSARSLSQTLGSTRAQIQPAATSAAALAKESGDSLFDFLDLRPERFKKRTSRPSKKRLFGACSALVLFALIVTLIFLLCLVQVGHYAGVHTGSWLAGLRGVVVDYAGLWRSLLTPGAPPPTVYLSVAAGLGVLFGLLPALLVLLVWVRTLLAQSARASLVRAKGNNITTWTRAWLDPEKGGCAAQFMRLETTLKPRAWRQQRRFTTCLWLLLSGATAISLLLIASAAMRAALGSDLALKRADEALREASARADSARNATAALAAAYARSRDAQSRLAAEALPAVNASLVAADASLVSAMLPLAAQDHESCYWCEPLRYDLMRARRALSIEAGAALAASARLEAAGAAVIDRKSVV